MHEEFCINCYKIILKKGIYCKKLLSPLARAEWIEIIWTELSASLSGSPLARAEWIEMPGPGLPAPQGLVSAHDRSEIYGDQNQKKGRRHTD